MLCGGVEVFVYKRVVLKDELVKFVVFEYYLNLDLVVSNLLVLDILWKIDGWVLGFF